MKRIPYKVLEKGLSGQEIVGRIQKGHMVRRSCWIEGMVIRICNEKGYDKNGNVIYDRDIPLYTKCTNGYFLHFASSNQPFKDMKSHRDGEGLEMLFATDWEDYGFISDKDFDLLIERIKDELREEGRKIYRRIEKESLLKQGYSEEELEITE